MNNEIVSSSEKKVAIVTGGSRGIGKAIVIKLASLGYNVALIYQNNSQKSLEVCEIASKYGADIKSYQCDVSSFDEVKCVVKQIKNDFGTIHILVNNAGVTRDSLVLNMKEDDFNSVIDTNLVGAFNMIRHCSQIFLKNKFGRIINISSIVGLIGNKGQSNYAASKAGLIGLTKSVAKELAGKNVNCNAIAPGFIMTDMTENLAETSEFVKQIPAGRLGEAQDIAELVAFLIGRGADYITGEVIRVDGGLAM